MKASDYIARFIEAQGVTHVFELSGGMITHMLDSLYELGTVQIVSMHHEQAAAFAADGYARVTGIPGVAMATSGPGATNLLTGMGSCFFDSVPAVFITGQVNQHEQKGTRAIRQLGFQETDIATMAAPIAKAVYKVEDANDLPSILHNAFETALSGRPGPVLIDVPMNLQRADVEADAPLRVTPVLPEADLSSDFWASFYGHLAGAKAPLILAGRGIISAFAKKELAAFSEKTGIPVITSLLAVDAIPADHPLRAGYMGAYGNRWTNLSIGDCDFMLVVGSRLDIRQTGADVNGFKGTKTIYHVDIEPGEINNRLAGCIPVISDVRSFLHTAANEASNYPSVSYAGWMDKIRALRAQWPDTQEIRDVKGINPNVFLNDLSAASREAYAFLADVGTHQMWSAQSLQLQAHQSFFTSGGMGAMGFSLPAAIGSTFALDKKPVVVICGDGSMQINIQELETIRRNRLPVKMVILNNQSLGMIRQFQDSYFDSKYQSTVWGYSAPDFEKVCVAYGIASSTISTPDDVNDGLAALWADPQEPYLLQVMIDLNANAYPKIAFGKPITEMEPFSKPIEMEGT